MQTAVQRKRADGHLQRDSEGSRGGQLSQTDEPDGPGANETAMPQRPDREDRLPGGRHTGHQAARVNYLI